MGFAPTTSRKWEADAGGTQAAFKMLSSATSRKRRAARGGQRDVSDFFEDGDGE